MEEWKGGGLEGWKNGRKISPLPSMGVCDLDIPRSFLYDEAVAHVPVRLTHPSILPPFTGCQRDRPGPGNETGFV
jgi:hypothetical protein